VRGKGAARRDPSMSDDGSRVFFESPVALTTRALDDVQVADTTELLEASEDMPLFAENVYEWELGGVGSCPAGSVSGCVFLVSDGRDVGVTRGPGPGCSAGSAVCLLGSDVSGGNVFFASTDALVASDTNTELDYYDARVCEAASPCVQAPPPSSQGCIDEASCHGLPPVRSPSAAGPTATFNGAGNLTPAVTTKVTKKTVKCKRGFVKKKIKKKETCVKRKRTKTKAKKTNRRAK
jgi:hypothetical protein